MTHIRETEEDLRRQTRLFQVFSRSFGREFNQFSSSSGKYRIDGYLYSKEDNAITAWVECKWYSGKAHCFLNVPKYDELVTLSRITKAPSYLLFREFDRWGYICLHDGKDVLCDYEIKMLGGTPSGRIKNDDDIEPLICLNKKHIIWGN